MKFQEYYIKVVCNHERRSICSFSFPLEGTRGVLINDKMLLQVVLTSEPLGMQMSYLPERACTSLAPKIKRTMLENLKLQEVCCQDSQPGSDYWMD